jgi:hypothetical protein
VAGYVIYSFAFQNPGRSTPTRNTSFGVLAEPGNNLDLLPAPESSDHLFERREMYFPEIIFIRSPQKSSANS